MCQWESSDKFIFRGHITRRGAETTGERGYQGRTTGNTNAIHARTYTILLPTCWVECGQRTNTTRSVGISVLPHTDRDGPDPYGSVSRLIIAL